MDLVDVRNHRYPEARRPPSRESRGCAAEAVGVPDTVDLDHLLQYSPLRRPADLFARRIIGLALGALEFGRADRALPRARGGGRSHPHLGHAVTLAPWTHERGRR